MLMLSFILHHGLVSVLLKGEKRLRYFLRSISLTAKVGLWILNVRIDSIGDRTQRSGPCLIVANHLSYIDVLVLLKDHPALFITSVEIREVPVLGKICELAACFFVERRKVRHGPMTKEAEQRDMRERLKEGFDVFLFPEGTSSDGSRVLPFKKTFFQIATDLRLNTKPLCLKYTGSSAQFVPWYGDMTFPGHLFKLCLQKEIRVRLAELPEISPRDKGELAGLAFEAIHLSYQAS